jgi:hypothetical protein
MLVLWFACGDSGPEHIRRTEAPEPAPAPVPELVPEEETADSGTTTETGLPELECDVPFEPCGGDFRGAVWRFVGICEGTEVLDSQAFCGEVDVLGANLYEGTVQFFADGTYLFELDSHISVSHYHWPPVCADEYCADYTTTYTTCADDGAGGCICDQVVDLGPEVLQGEWWIDTYYGQNPELQVGQQFQNGSSAFEQWKWCVDGDELRLRGWFGNVQVLVREL